MDKGILIEYADIKEEIKDLRRRIEKIQKELDKLHEQIVVDSVSCELRIIFRLYFLDDLSYPKVADQMNKMFPKRRIRYTDENIKKKIQRYFENVPQCPDKK